MEEQQSYLTVQEVAQALRVSPLTIYRAIHEGRLEAVRLGDAGPFRVPADAIDTYAQPVRRTKTSSPRSECFDERQAPQP